MSIIAKVVVSLVTTQKLVGYEKHDVMKTKILEVMDAIMRHSRICDIRKLRTQ